MILDRHGELTTTNAREREHDCIEVVLAFPTLIEAFEEWLTTRGLYLFQILRLDPEENLPAYGIGSIGAEVRGS